MTAFFKTPNVENCTNMDNDIQDMYEEFRKFNMKE